MRAQRTSGPSGPPPLRSIIDFGAEGGGGAPPGQRVNSIESGMHHRSGSVDRGMGGLGGGLGGGAGAGGDGGLSFYGGDAAAQHVPRGSTPPGQIAGGQMGQVGMGMGMGQMGGGAGHMAPGKIGGGGGSSGGGGAITGKPLSRVYSSSGAFLGEVRALRARGERGGGRLGGRVAGEWLAPSPVRSTAL
ncbi:hypothetical protein T492DRAFT_150073 [Pavlovales sp. CCMP2436]|nr:hypothetical protein T492DRAFT_150073 [Pavlovales sp. CCMP2436]